MIDPHDCDIKDFIAYTQSLLTLGLATSTIKNIISATRLMCKWHNVNRHLWTTDLWNWNIKSLVLANRKPPKLQTVVSFTDFVKAVILSEQRNWPHVKLSSILGFLGLLRISNIAPLSAQNLDVTRNTLLQDIRICINSMLIKIKWAKNLQVGAETLTLPLTTHKVFCPVTSWSEYVNNYLPSGLNLHLPLLLQKHDQNLIIIDQRALRKLQKKVWYDLGLAHKNYTPHSLRRGGGGGATFYAEQGLPLDEVKKLGLWKSDSIQVYSRN